MEGEPARWDVAEGSSFKAAGRCRAVVFASFRMSATSPSLDYRQGAGVTRSDLSFGTMLRYSLGRAACSPAVRGETD
jgi:hypothetical protein